MSNTIVAIFKCYSDAENAANDIRQKGLRTDNISIIVNNKKFFNNRNGYGHINIDKNGLMQYKMNRKNKISDGIITGGIIGGVIGIIIGAISIAMQSSDILSAIGPIGGLAIGLISGGLLGGLLDFSISRTKFREYTDLISNGNVLFSMKVDEDRIDSISDILSKNEAISIKKY